MRKNISKVIDAFMSRKPANGDSKRTCWTDGKTIYSYALPIARWESNGHVGVIPEGGLSRTTTSQVRACRLALDQFIPCDRHEDCRQAPLLGIACKRGCVDTSGT